MLQRVNINFEIKTKLQKKKVRLFFNKKTISPRILIYSKVNFIIYLKFIFLVKKKLNQKLLETRKTLLISIYESIKVA